MMIFFFFQMYQPFLSVFRHCPLLKFQIFKQPPFPPVTSLQKQVTGKFQVSSISGISWKKRKKRKSKKTALEIPPPCGVKSHTGDDGQVVCATKLENQTPGVKVPDFNNLKSEAFLNEELAIVKTSCIKQDCSLLTDPSQQLTTSRNSSLKPQHITGSLWETVKPLRILGLPQETHNKMNKR